MLSEDESDWHLRARCSGVSQSQGGCEELNIWSLTPPLIGICPGTGSVKEQSVSQGLTVSASVALKCLKGKRLLLPPDSNITSVHHDVEGIKVSPPMAVASCEAWLHFDGSRNKQYGYRQYCTSRLIGSANHRPYFSKDA